VPRPSSRYGELPPVGPATRAVTERLAPGSVVVGVRFRTGAAPPLLGVSARELVDRVVGSADIWDRAGIMLAEPCGDASGGSEGPTRLRVVVDALLDRLEEAPAVDPVATRAASMLAAPPAPPVWDLARRFDLSERQLRRRIEVAAGYPPGRWRASSGSSGSWARRARRARPATTSPASPPMRATPTRRTSPATAGGSPAFPRVPCWTGRPGAAHRPHDPPRLSSRRTTNDGFQLAP
jgi:hypothetical protein